MSIIIAEPGIVAASRRRTGGGGGAAPVYGSSVASRTTSTFTLVVTRPACNPGDLLIIQACTFTGTITTLAGWTSLVDVTHGPFTGARGYIFYKIAGSSEPSTYSFTCSSSTAQDAMCSVFTGVNAAPIDVSATAATPGNTTTPTCPAVTTTKANDLICHFWWVANPTTTTPPGGETKQYQQTSSPGNTNGGLLVLATIAKAAAGAAATSALTCSPTATTNNPMATVALAAP